MEMLFAALTPSLLRPKIICRGVNDVMPIKFIFRNAKRGCCMSATAPFDMFGVDALCFSGCAQFFWSPGRFSMYHLPSTFFMPCSPITTPDLFAI